MIGASIRNIRRNIGEAKFGKRERCHCAVNGNNRQRRAATRKRRLEDHDHRNRIAAHNITGKSAKRRVERNRGR